MFLNNCQDHLEALYQYWLLAPHLNFHTSSKEPSDGVATCMHAWDHTSIVKAVTSLIAHLFEYVLNLDNYKNLLRSLKNWHISKSPLGGLGKSSDEVFLLWSLPTSRLRHPQSVLHKTPSLLILLEVHSYNSALCIRKLNMCHKASILSMNLMILLALLFMLSHFLTVIYHSDLIFLISDVKSLLHIYVNYSHAF